MAELPEIQRLAEKIRDWEMDAGESFTDYFMHDRVYAVSWAFWLAGKGYTDKANEIIHEVESGNKCIDQELLFYVVPNIDWTEEVNFQNILIWSDFLLATKTYVKRVTEFFNEYEKDLQEKD